MSKFQLKRLVHDMNMAWRAIVPSKWRLRLTEENGVLTLWNAERRVHTAWCVDDMWSTLLLLNRLWAQELPA